MSDSSASTAAADQAQPKSGDVPREGDVIAGKFQVERVLATGGMGIVFAAQHLTLGQRVAVKMMLPEAMELPSAVERFQREAQAAAGIENEHVVRILDVGKLDSGVPYMVMEYLVGCDLGDLVKGGRSVPVQHGVDYVLQACEAMAEAHRLGIVHRDLKPGNVFLTKRADGTPLIKVLDFGISKLGDDMLSREQGSLTATSMMMGSPLYMSPEQIRSAKNVDRRADIWSLGIILFEILTGMLPFEGENAIAICAQIAADPPVPLRFIRPEYPEGLEAVILRCLEKEPERRFDDVGALANALAPFASPAGQRSAENVLRSLAHASSQMPTLHAAKIKLDVRLPPKSAEAPASPRGAKTLAVDDAGPSGGAAAIATTAVATPAPGGASPVAPRGRTSRDRGGHPILFLLFAAGVGYGAWTFRARIADALHGMGVSAPFASGATSAPTSADSTSPSAEGVPTAGDAGADGAGASLPTTSGATTDVVDASDDGAAALFIDLADAGDGGDDEDEDEDLVEAGLATSSPAAHPTTPHRHPAGHGKPHRRKKRH